MCAHDHHCPFLNKSDARCSDHFHLSNLEHAFEYCFDRYQACPVYLERLVERRVRRIESKLVAEANEVELPARSRHAHASKASQYEPGRLLVQVSVSARGLAHERVAA